MVSDRLITEKDLSMINSNNFNQKTACQSQHKYNKAYKRTGVAAVAQMNRNISTHPHEMP